MIGTGKEFVEEKNVDISVFLLFKKGLRRSFR